MASLKEELETWAAGLQAYDAQDLEGALDLFQRIGDTSKILTNIGLIYATIGEHEQAVDNYARATQLDEHLAVAFFQAGVSLFLLGQFEAGLQEFDTAFFHLRGNSFIDYDQLGLAYKLYSAEVLFNRGLCRINLGDIDGGMQDLEEARQSKCTADHAVIDEAIKDQAVDYTVFSLPVGVLYRPPEKKLKNLKAKDYMGSARLVGGKDGFTAFTGDSIARENLPSVQRSGTFSAPRQVDPVARPAASLSRAPTTISVPANARERIAAATANMAESQPPARKAMPERQPTTTRAPVPRSTSAEDNFKANTAPLNPQSKPAGSKGRATQFYDDLLDSYGGEDAFEASPTAPPLPAIGRSNTRNPGYAGSNSGGSVRRKLTRRPTQARGSRYEEEEEGYASGEDYELVKIRVKIYHEDDVRGMAILSDTPWLEFRDRVNAKFGRTSGLVMKFRDEDGQVSLRDDDDYQLAIETALMTADARLEIWCSDA